MAPWNELWVKLLLKPHRFSVVQLTLVPVELSPAWALRAQMGFVCSSCTLHFTQECAGHFEANFYSLHTNVRTQVAFQPAYQLEQKIQHLCVTFPQDEEVCTPCASVKEMKTENHNIQTLDQVKWELGN